MTSSIVDTHHAIVGSSGMGKTVTGKAEAEQLIRGGRHIAIIDPTDVWYGLRSNARGTGRGLDIPIFGGLHGDMAIGPSDGEAVARIIIEQNVSAIVSLGQIHDAVDQRRFMAAFVKRLRHKPKGNFHLIVDEADEACPQTPVDDIGFRLLQDMIWIAKRGRAAGFVLTAITQRPADISKAVLSQMQTIIAHRLIDPRDQKAIDDYLKAKGDKAARDQVMQSLPELAIGERWIYSPGAQLLERGTTPAIATFDSSRTPAPGETHVEPKMLGQIDVAALAAALAKPADAADAKTKGDAVGAYVAGAAAGEAFAERDRRIAELEDMLEGERRARAEKDSAIAAAIETLQAAAFSITKPKTEAREAEPKAKPAGGARGQGVAGKPGGDDPATPEAAIRGRKALEALARIHPAGLTENQWAALAGYARSGGTWGTYKGQLRSAGLIALDGQLWRSTKAGLKAAGVKGGELPDLGPELVRFWTKRIPGVTRMGEVLLQRWPHFTTREGLAADLGMAAAGGTFGTYLGRLRSNGLLEEKAKRIRLNPEMMGAAR